MKPELREVLGKTAFEAWLAFTKPEVIARPWQDIDAAVQEAYCIEAEAVVNKLASMLIPAVIQTLLSEEQITAILRSLGE